MLKLPGPVLLSTLFRLSHLLREFWSEELTKEDQTRMNQNIFYSEEYNFFGMERVGGLFSYLKDKYKEVVKSKLGYPLDNKSHNQNESDTCKYFILFFYLKGGCDGLTVTRFMVRITLR